MLPMGGVGEGELNHGIHEIKKVGRVTPCARRGEPERVRWQAAAGRGLPALPIQ